MDYKSELSELAKNIESVIAESLDSLKLSETKNQVNSAIDRAIDEVRDALDKAGDKLDARVTVNASRPDPDKLRVFETKCTDRQAREWLLQMSEGAFDPDFSQWKDITKNWKRKPENKKGADYHG